MKCILVLIYILLIFVIIIVSIALLKKKIVENNNFLKKGIGIYVAPLPRYIKKEIVNLYNKDELKTLIVTTAFTDGVNTNASNLILQV